ncbi:MAG TPA: HmuY family protein [Myxococcota bacterium]
MRVVLSMLMTGALAAPLATTMACEAPAEGEGEGEGEGEPTPKCTEPRAVECEDEVFTDLTMNLDTAAPGEVTSSTDGDGFVAVVDGTAGGFGGDGGWVYAKFTATGLEKVTLLDADSFTSMEWDVAFRRFVIRLNSGYGGPSCVTGARTATGTVYEDLAALPDGLSFSDEQFMSDPESCELVPDGSGLGSAGVVLQNYWEYPGCVAMTGNVYVLSLADGRHVKFDVTDYYASGQETCDESGTPGTTSAMFTVRHGYLE